MDQIHFEKKLKKLEGQPFHTYKDLSSLSVTIQNYSVLFKHIQGSVGASPASLCQLVISSDFLPLPEWSLSSVARITAAEDYILRIFNDAVTLYAQQNRGDEGSGSFQTVKMPQQILKRNIVHISAHLLSIDFRISLPGSAKKTTLYKDVIQMFSHELPQIVKFIKDSILEKETMKQHCDCVEDMLTLQDNLSQYGLIAFVADGSLLARESGTSDRPAHFHVVPFKAPNDLAIEVVLPNAGKIRGLGLRSGINTIIGGGYHGKSTLLNALAKTIYPHIPGDGREQVAVNKQSVYICAEEGRSVRDLNISSFFSLLPQASDPHHYNTDNASGSTSEASAVIEYVQAGAKLLLIDEDSSAANFLYRDPDLRKLIPEDPIIPFFDRVQELYTHFGVSTLIVASGSPYFLAVSDRVIAMKEYLPVDMTQKIRDLNDHRVLASKVIPKTNLSIFDKRILCLNNFNPEYINKRLQKAVPIRIKALRGQEHNIIEYGMDQIDVRYLYGIVDSSQLMTIGYLLLLSKQLSLYKKKCSPTELAQKLADLTYEKGLNILNTKPPPPTFFAQISALEMAGALNRLRSLQVHVEK